MVTFMQLFQTIQHLFHPRRSNNHRARILHPDSILSLALVVLGFAAFVLNVHYVSPDIGGVLGYASDISVDQVVSYTNAERAKSGLGAVTLNGSLNNAARLKADDMFANQYWSHVSPAGKQPWDFMKQAGYSFSAAGENLARDFSTTPEMIAAWMGSPSHKANIMNAKYQEMGVAVVNGTLQGVETTLVVQMFGRSPKAAAAAQIPQQAVQQTKVVDVAENSELATTVEPAVVPEATPEVVSVITQAEPESVVLADTVTTPGTIRPASPFSPLDVMKAVFLSVLVILMAALAYDAYVFEQRNTVRVVGKNFAHLLFFATIATVVVFFKAGVIK